MAIKPVNKSSISEQVFEQMKYQILSGEWPVGMKIPSENDLAVTMNVSRVTIRQALQKLAVFGLMETKTGEGSFVQGENLGKQMKVAITPSAYLQPHSLREVFDFRRAIEIQSAGLAAKYAVDEQIAKLAEIYQHQANIERHSTETFAKLDLEFHLQIARCTGNTLILTVYEVMWDILSVAMQKTVSKMGFHYGVEYHAQLLKAISDHDIDRAEQVMRAHLEKNDAMAMRD